MSKTTNRKQLDILLNAMQFQPDIARGWFKGSKEELNGVWRNLEAELNAAGPPSKSIAEWKKAWCDQKKYVRHKAAQNFKFSNGTGGGPNMEQKLSPYEEAIYNLVCMKESVEGVANKFGLGSTNPTTESVSNTLLDLLDDVVESSAHNSENETPQKPPAKRIKPNTKNGLDTLVSLRDVLTEKIGIQKQILESMKEQQQITRKVYRSIDRLYDLKKAELEEQKRHNLVMEKLRLKEIEDKIEKNRRLLKLEELKY